MALAIAAALALTAPLIQWLATSEPGLHPYALSALTMIPFLLAAAGIGKRPGQDIIAYGLCFAAGSVSVIVSAVVHSDPVPGGLIRPASAMPLLVTAVLVPFPGPITALGLANIVASVVGASGQPVDDVVSQALGQLAAGAIAVAISFGWRITRRTAQEAMDLEAEVAHKDIERKAVARFVRHAAHELRTPLTPMRLMPATLRQRGDDPAVREKLFMQLDRQVDRLTSIVNRLGVLASLESIHDHDPSDLVQQAHRVADAFPGTDLQSPASASTAAPEDGVYAMLSELVANAHEATNDTVRLRIQEEGSGWLVTVEDDGDGVPETFWETLKQPFGRVQLDDHPHARAGLGLGLVDAMAAAIGGRLELGRSDLGGLCASLHLPPANVPVERRKGPRRTPG